MANPARKYDERPDEAPRPTDPLSATPPLPTDPLSNDPRFQPANDPRIDRTTIVQSRGTGNGVLVTALVIVLAVIAYFVFAPSAPETTVPSDQPATTSEPATPTPDATAPAAPADPVTPAPDATAPTTPADPAAPAPDSTAPAQPSAPAPAEPAPAQ